MEKSIRIKKRHDYKQIPITFGVVLFTLCTLFPLVITIFLSLKGPSDFDAGIWSFPKQLRFDNFLYFFSSQSGTMYKNMFISIGTGVLIGVVAIFISSLAAYVFVRYEFPFKRLLFTLIILLMMVPGILTLTSSVLNIQMLGLYNTVWAVILPGIASNLVGSFFLFYTFMQQQPQSLFEAAKVDGASDMHCYFKIALPLCLPIIIIQFIGIFAAQYNDFLWPTLVIEDSSSQMLMPVLKDVASNLAEENPGVTYALYICSGLPLILTTIFGLKYFINGDFAAGMKV